MFLCDLCDLCGKIAFAAPMLSVRLLSGGAHYFPLIRRIIATVSRTFASMPS